jgi:hypothetical protein
MTPATTVDLHKLRFNLRVAVTVALLALFVAITYIAYLPCRDAYRKLTAGDVFLDDLSLQDLSSKALDIHLERSSTLLSYNIVLGGLMWSLIVFSKEQRTIRVLDHGSDDWPEFISFVIGNCFLICNCLAYWADTAVIESLLESGARASTKELLSLPDIYDSRVQTLVESEELGTFWLATVVASLYISLHQLKEDRP